MAQEAYDFARFETQQMAQLKQNEQQLQQGTVLRSVKGGGKPKQTALQKVFGNMVQVLLVVVFFGTAFALVQSEAKLTEYTQQIQAQQEDLQVAKSKYNYLENTLNASINLQQVEKVVKELGLVKVDESQVTYIRLQEEAVCSVEASNLTKWSAAVQGMWAQLLDYLDP